MIKLIRKEVLRNGRRSVSLTAGMGLFVQLGRPLVSLLTLPVLLGHLGQAGLGVWMIALSLMGLIGALNAGLSISLVTLIGRASSDGSLTKLQMLSTAATLIAFLTAASVVILTLPIALVVNWADLLDLTSDPSGDQVRWMMVVLALLLGFGMISSVPRQIMLGRMHGYLSHLLDFAGLLVGSIGLVIAVFMAAPLWVLALTFMGPSSLIMIVGGMVYLKKMGVPLFSLKNLDKETLGALGRDSLRMAGYQSAYAISSQSDLFLIGMILGAPASAVYGVAHRVFSLPIMVATTVNYAQWPAIARADSSGDHANITQILRKTLLIGSTGATTVAILLALTYQPLINLWLGNRLETDLALIIGMVAWVAIATLVNTLDMVLRARNETQLLMRSMMVMAVINIATTLILLPIIGPAGAIWGSVTGYAVALLVPYLIRLRKILYKTSRERKSKISGSV